ncbi:MAG TPA: cyclase family protein [Gammaproteobacteria bacterium]|nr:cyclase family protein [Gammaproteobacteria bacterium]
MRNRLMIGLVAGVLSWPAFALDIGDYRLVDLTHAYNSDTLYWPTSPSEFEKKELATGETEGGWFYSAYSICTPEHGGTHLDAPRHFAADGITADRMPLDKLIAPAVVIDVSEQAADDRNYRLSTGDVRAFEKAHGRIEPGTIVLMRSGWSRHWPDAMGYLGDDTPGDASKLEFPGFGEEPARLLVEDRQVAMLGVDTASIDYGKSKDFIVHRISAAENVGALENLTNLDQLPPSGFVIVALPMKIEGGSGGPARVVALVPE